MNAKKRKLYSRLVIIAIVLVILIPLFIFAGSILWFPPKNLGMSYEKTEIEAVKNSLGIEIIRNGSNDDTLVWEFSDYEHKEVEITSNEFTALINEIKPDDFYLEDMQVKVVDNIVRLSAKANLDNLNDNILADARKMSPIPLPSKVNFYTESAFSIKDKVIAVKPYEVSIGMLNITSEIDKDLAETEVAGYIKKYFDKVPNMEVNDLYIVDGNFHINAYIPTKAIGNPK
ncbi:MAG: hypothetical protein GX967_02565 [Clostridiales bacterium]|nr:hypothetical protein [Clostridiales bacterium]